LRNVKKSLTSIPKKIFKGFVNKKNPTIPLRLLSSLKANKTALFSYLSGPLSVPDNSTIFFGHSNKWKSKEIARILLDIGYNVDAIDFNELNFVPEKKYDVIFDIAYNIYRFDRYLDSNTIKLLHMTGSYPTYQDVAETQRVQAANQRKKTNFIPRRINQYPDQVIASLEIADSISLIGNEHTLSTYLEKYHKKIHLITTTASYIEGLIKKRENYIPAEREYLWFFGSGAIHKGLDLVLDSFSVRTDLHLNVVGNIQKEKDFLEEYHNELYNLPNISYYGYLTPVSETFKQVVKRTYCFIAPSCSEGISPAVATCLQIGLFPIISHDTGIDLPPGCGIYLKTCNIDEILDALDTVSHMSPIELANQIHEIQAYSLKQYSQEQFHKDMKNYLSNILLEGIGVTK
jgi:hypothetical protein